MKKMRSVLFTFGVVILNVLFFTSCDKDKDISPETLTVKEVTLSSSSSGFGLKSIKVIDEESREVSFSDNANNWFENATLQSITMPAGTSISFSPNGLKVLSIIQFDFNVDSKNYAIGVGPGSKFVVQKTNTGKYKLLPEKTVQVSPV